VYSGIAKAIPCAVGVPRLGGWGDQATGGSGLKSSTLRLARWIVRAGDGQHELVWVAADDAGHHHKYAY